MFLKILYSSINLKFRFTSDTYDASSVEKMENFLLACQKEISDGKLWLAMQANVLSDQSDTKDDFERRYKEMMTNLENLFTVPALNMNMRNGEKVNKACQEVKYIGTNSAYNVSETIVKLPPPTTSCSQSHQISQVLQAPSTSSSHEDPILIPVNENDLESNFQNILKPVLDLKTKKIGFTF